MIVVLDTNVIISALLSPTGAPAEIVRRWEAGEFDAAVSPLLLAELEKALAYPQVTRYLRLSKEQVSTFLKGYSTVAMLVEPQMRLEVVSADPGDDRVLECAVEAGAGFIITGDQHLLDLKEYQGIVILPPAGFLVLLA